MNTQRQRRRIAALTAAMAAVALVGACGGGDGGSGGSASGPKAFSFLAIAENTAVPAALTSLSTGACAAENTALPLTVETVPQASLDQRLQLLAGQNALPVQYAAGNAPKLTQELAAAGQVLDFEPALTQLGVLDKISPAAVSTIKSLYGGKLNVLPYEYNVEGIWYNKKLFAANGIAEPATWDELVAAAAKLKAAGVTPFSASGEQGWPLTRLLSGYLFRSLGSDALSKVADGQAKLTDPQYVAAAQKIADLGKQEYFGKGVGSIDYDTSVSQFLTGKAGMLYMGSWVLGNVNDPKQNKIGADNVGFMPFPAVTGGSGDIAEYPSNVGLPMTFSAKTYNDKTGAWLKCITQNYGTTALKAGSLSGFVAAEPVADVAPLTSEVQDRITKSTSSVLWFEALFDTKSTTTSQTNAARLATGGISAADFMKLVQDDLDAAK